MAGITDAEHTEYGQEYGTPLITLVSCPVPDRADGTPRLAGMLRVKLEEDSLTGRIYGRHTVDEAYTCNYELNPAFQAALTGAGLRITGVDEAGDVRAVELPGHPFFIATLFQPQRSSAPGRPHPLIRAYLEAALRFRTAAGAYQNPGVEPR